jgi:hypothetical protein
MKAGRPHKNIYDCMRFQRMYEWVSRFSQLNDYQIAKRMYERDINASSSLDTLKGFIHHIKNGRIAKTKPYYIWLLAKSLLKEYPDENRNWKVTEEFKEILNILCCKLHAVASDDFVVTGSNEPDSLVLIGWTYHQEISLISAKPLEMPTFARKIFSTLTNDWTLNTADIAVDVAELLDSTDIKTVTNAVKRVVEDFKKSGIGSSTIFRAKHTLFYEIKNPQEFDYDYQYISLLHDLHDDSVSIAVSCIINYVICQIL